MPAGIAKRGKDAWNQWRKSAHNNFIDLRDAKCAPFDFRGFELSNVTFAGADLPGANVEGCTFVRCDLRGTNFIGAILRNAGLRDCIVNNATAFSDADVSGFAMGDGTAGGEGTK